MTTKVAPLGSSPRVGVLQFPGSNCDTDCIDVLTRHLDANVSPIWYQETTLPPLDAVVVPGGFSFGDYLRSGALASHASIMTEVKKFVDRGGAVIGICNGFQILVESKILPGVLLHNMSQKFICDDVYLKDPSGKVLRMPIAHGEGRYWIDEPGRKSLEDKNLIAYRYTTAKGEITQSANPNGALGNIAGVFSPNKKVLGMMPHPERATDKVLGGSTDGLVVWQEFFSRI